MAGTPDDANTARLASSLLGRLAAWCYDHRRRVLLGWLLAVAVVAGSCACSDDGGKAPGQGLTPRTA